MVKTLLWLAFSFVVLTLPANIVTLQIIFEWIQAEENQYLVSFFLN
jgi:hypothetical protein